MKFYQCDVAESGTDNNIWTSAVFPCEHEEEAEFAAMLSLQQDWGDEYIPDSFIEAFGDSESTDDPEFPGVNAWNEGGYWDDWRLMSSISIGMLEVPTLEALAQLKKVECRLNDAQINAIMNGTAVATIIINPAPRS